MDLIENQTINEVTDLEPLTDDKYETMLVDNNQLKSKTEDTTDESSRSIMLLIRRPRRSISADLSQNNHSYLKVNNSSAVKNLINMRDSIKNMVEEKPPGRPRKNSDDSGLFLNQIEQMFDNHVVANDKSMYDKLKPIIDNIKIITDDINSRLNKIETAIQSSSLQINNLTNQVVVLKVTSKKHKTQIKAINNITDDCTDLINRMNNVILFGVPEATEQKISDKDRKKIDEG
ncbi:hypothetical protein HCN44_000316 [Aphidius gifuensis]|uniref:Uncharacterized protein n=1 Tax=Aphidius gifuensis TaxID=684658 RepID=A0A834XTH4_APHGI|nr:hypothetical protein HCN44_000316 [Aphidius gifuensis]